MKIEDILTEESIINLKKDNSEKLSRIKVGTLLECLKCVYTDINGKIYNKKKKNLRTSVPVVLNEMEKRKAKGILKTFLKGDVGNDVVIVVEKHKDYLIAENINNRLGKNIKFRIDSDNIINFKRHRKKK